MKTRALLTLAVALVSLLLSSCAMSQGRIEACFRRNKADLTIVKEFLAGLEYPVIALFQVRPHYEMRVSGQSITIEDDEVVAAIGRLRERGYRTIWKSNNLIDFQRWASLDTGRGVLYSIDGSDPNDWNRGLPATYIYVIPLDELGWFYYVSDYNRWHERNR